MKSRVLVASLIVLLAVSFKGVAEDSGKSTLVVTATMVADEASRVPASVMVISGEEIRNSTAVNLDDALRTVPGVSVLRNYGIGYGIPNQINVRGVPGLHGLLILADGYQVNEAATGFLSPNEIPLIAVKQVEFVRGPFSALYGADAFSGVMNVLLKQPGEKPGMEFVAGLGNWDSANLSALISGGTPEAGYLVAVEAMQMDNLLARHERIETFVNPATGFEEERTVPVKNYDYKDLRILALAGWDVGEEGRFSLQARYYGSELGYGQVDRRPLYPELVNSDMENNSYSLGTEYLQLLESGALLKLRGQYRHQSRETCGLDILTMHQGYPVFSRSRSLTDSDEVRMEFSAVLPVSDGHNLVCGTDWRYTTADFGGLKNYTTGDRFLSSMQRDKHVTDVGLFVQDSIELGESVRLVTGLRADKHSSFGTVLSPKAGVSCDLGKGVAWRLAGGRAFRAPSLLELYQPDINFGSIIFSSNPDLEPEYINSADTGLAFSYDRLQLDVGVFYNDIKDLIAPGLSSGALRYDNIDKARTMGVEISSAWDVADNVRIIAGGTVQDTEDKNTKLDLDYAPEILASLGVRTSFDLGGYELKTFVEARYSGSRGYTDETLRRWVKFDSYVVVNMNVTMDLGNWVIAADLQNVFDEKYQESSVVNPALGQTYMIKAGVKF